MAKTRIVSLASHGVADNSVTIFGVTVAILIMVILVFVPGLSPIFFTGALGGPVWPVTLIYGAWMLAFTEAVKWAARTDPHGFVARHVAW